MSTRDQQMRNILSHQLGHLAWLLLLLVGLYGTSHIEGFATGSFLGVSTMTWVVLAVGNAVVHQVFVWFCWRTELHSGLLTRRLGTSAFLIYKVLFAILILARPILITGLAISNAHTFAANPKVMMALGAVFAVPSVYLMYSVKRYFGFDRAFGIDHFDASYRTEPLVRQGIFRYSSNAMYVYGFLLLWIPGLLLQSTAALVVALFSHLYIWVHYFCTEKPDMEQIYGATGTQDTR